MTRIAFVSALLILAGPASARSQETTARRLAHAPARHMELWAGYAASSPNLRALGSVPGNRFALASTRWTRAINRGATHVAEWTVDLIPLAMTEASRSTVARYGSPGVSEMTQGPVLGFGVSPLGVSAILGRSSRVQPRVGASGGFLLFERAVPTTEATKFNFTATLEAGVQIVNGTGSGLTALYRFHHLSNASLGKENFAMASHLFSLGLRWAR